MKKKDKKLKNKLKKGKGKLKRNAKVTEDAVVQTLTDKIKKLKAELKDRDKLIGNLHKRLKKSDSKGEKSDKKSKKQIGGATKFLRSQRTARIGVAQKQAWKQHGFLRDRYEYHLESGQANEIARVMANQDLMESFGEEVGYSEQELETILS
jgi:predicted RNase H-like nuclease (RuvC/YqgF family)